MRAAGLAGLALIAAVVIALRDDEPRAAAGILAHAPRAHASRAEALRPRPSAPREPHDYLAELLLRRDSVVMRWPDRRERPIRVWLRSAPRNAAVRAAFDAWQATGIPVRFRFVADSSAAEVRGTWVDRFDDPVSGRTVWSRDDAHWLRTSTITLARHHAWGRALDSASVYALALHEVGHALGLDHTRDTQSIMAPRVRARTLSAADVATVRALYALPAGTLR